MSGTPKTLFEAILNGMLIGPIGDAPQNIEAHVIDFLNQKFQWAEFAYSDDLTALEAIRSLAARIGVKPPEFLDLAWKALKLGDVETLQKILRSHPEVASVDVMTASDMEKMASNE